MDEKLITTSKNIWSSGQLAAFVIMCLAIGIAGGQLIRHAHASAGSSEAAYKAPVSSQLPPGLPSSPSPSPEQVKAAIDAQAAPLLAELKDNANDFASLVDLGNLYYDAKQYPTAIEYYERALAIQPAETSVRTDMATAIWYAGKADQAIAEFQKVLTEDPNKANALFNLGIVKWRGKKDAAGAISLWQRLLATTPNYDERAQVEDLIRRAEASEKQ